MFIITKIETAVYLAEALCVNVHKSHLEESSEEPAPSQIPCDIILTYSFSQHFLIILINTLGYNSYCLQKLLQLKLLTYYHDCYGICNLLCYYSTTTAANPNVWNQHKIVVAALFLLTVTSVLTVNFLNKLCFCAGVSSLKKKRCERPWLLQEEARNILSSLGSAVPNRSVITVQVHMERVNNYSGVQESNG